MLLWVQVVISLLALCARAQNDNGDSAEDAIAYPIITENLREKNEQGRIPMYAPKRCPEDQLLYPGQQDADWACDCAPGYLYHPATDKCYGAYLRGPCPRGQYLVLRTEDTVPKCIVNECEQDKQVMYEGQCWELEKPGGPCGKLEENGGRILGVNATTLQPGCLIRNTNMMSQMTHFMGIKQQNNNSNRNRNNNNSSSRTNNIVSNSKSIVNNNNYNDKNGNAPFVNPLRNDESNVNKEVASRKGSSRIRVQKRHVFEAMSTSSYRPLKCPPGSKRAVLGKCRVVFD